MIFKKKKFPIATDLQPVHAELGDQCDIIRERGVVVVYVIEVRAVNE